MLCGRAGEGKGISEYGKYRTKGGRGLKIHLFTRRMAPKRSAAIKSLGTTAIDEILLYCLKCFKWLIHF